MDYERAIVVEKLESVDLHASRSVIYDWEIELRLPFEDPVSGTEHYLVRYPSGLKTGLHRHRSPHHRGP